MLFVLAQLVPGQEAERFVYPEGLVEELRGVDDYLDVLGELLEVGVHRLPVGVVEPDLRVRIDLKYSLYGRLYVVRGEPLALG
tara:strand:- start:179 stop:427 length:249 start_codon:yes stop_codon:yes gene_type:complete